MVLRLPKLLIGLVEFSLVMLSFLNWPCRQDWVAVLPAQMFGFLEKLLPDAPSKMSTA
jgi:hypothetical protein